MSEKAIRIAAMLYERRDLARTILGEGYQEHVQAAAKLLRASMARHEEGLVPSLSTELRKVLPQGRAGELAALSLCAAAVEIEEGDQ